jgi:hypothetical protein
VRQIDTEPQRRRRARWSSPFLIRGPAVEERSEPPLSPQQARRRRPSRRSVSRWPSGRRPSPVPPRRASSRNLGLETVKAEQARRVDLSGQPRSAAPPPAPAVCTAWVRSGCATSGTRPPPRCQPARASSAGLRRTSTSTSCVPSRT